MKVAELFEKLDQYKAHGLQAPKDASVTKVETPEHAAEIIKAQCSTFVAAYKAANKCLYRGVQEVDGDLGGDLFPSEKLDIIAANIRPDRKPLYMEKENHELISKAMGKLGQKATRKNALFCTTRKSCATDWGIVYILFLKDGWNVSVFDEIKNDYAFHQVQKLADSALYAARKDKSVDPLDHLVTGLKELKPRNISSSTDLAEIIEERYFDVLASGSSYIGLKVGSAFSKRVLSLLGLEMRMANY